MGKWLNGPPSIRVRIKQGKHHLQDNLYFLTELENLLFCKMGWYLTTFHPFIHRQCAGTHLGCISLLPSSKNICYFVRALWFMKCEYANFDLKLCLVLSFLLENTVVNQHYLAWKCVPYVYNCVCLFSTQTDILSLSLQDQVSSINVHLPKNIQYFWTSNWAFSKINWVHVPQCTQNQLFLAHLLYIIDSGWRCVLYK